jgi:hypothetical protein
MFKKMSTAGLVIFMFTLSVLNIGAANPIPGACSACQDKITKNAFTDAV